MEEVRTLYVRGHAIDEITRLTGHTSLTVKNYLKEDYPVTNGHYGSSASIYLARGFLRKAL